jgi:outer membrane protein assembly factor BamB
MLYHGLGSGLVTYIGYENSSLLADALYSRSCILHVLEDEPDEVSNARRRLLERDMHAPLSSWCERLTVAQFDGVHLPYADNMVNRMIISEDYDVPISEVMRVLVPGGIALIHDEEFVKPVPEETDDWTHWLHGSDGNAVSGDQLVGPPRQLQWAARPYWARLHDAPSSTSAMVSSNGRLFYISDEGPAGTYEGLEDSWHLVARDAYNGMLLWKRPMPDWGWKQWTDNWHARNNQPFQLPKRLVAVGDTVFVTLGFDEPVTALDGATGLLIRTYKDTERTDEILYSEGRLILSINETEHVPGQPYLRPFLKRIAVLDPNSSNKMLWKKGYYSGIAAKSDSLEPNGRLELAAGDGRIYLCDQDSIRTLDMETGDELWRTARLIGPQLNANFNTRMFELPVLVYSDGVVLFAQPEGRTTFHTVPGTLYAYNATNGELLWSHPYGGWVHNTQPNVFVISGTVWIHEHQEGAVLQGTKMVLPRGLQENLNYAVLGLDLKTGEETNRHSTRDIFNVGHHHRCYRNKATERLLMMSRRGVEYLDVATGEIDVNHWVRGDCHLGVMPANGLLYTTPHPCSCYIETKLNGFFALAPAATEDPEESTLPDYVQGLAFATELPKAEPSNEDWSSFRGNSQRSGSSPTVISPEPALLWKTDIGTSSGPLTISDGKVFAPVLRQNRLVVLDAESGAFDWDFYTEAPIDSPPTIYRGMALFGSADGWAYCLRTSDGELIWKRRLAPRNRWISNDCCIESAWPVHGSILIQNGTAYATAGRSSFLDGGIHLYALQPETGKLLAHRVEYTPDSVSGGMTPDPSYAMTMPGMLSDILVGDDLSVWMRNNRVFGPEDSVGKHVYATGGFRDDSWFNRTTWGMGPVAHAQLLSYDESTAYAIEAFSSTSRVAAFTPGSQGYRLFAVSLINDPAVTSTMDAQSGQRRGGYSKRNEKWTVLIPLRGTAMAATRNTLFVAGAPDIVDPNDTLASFEGRQGGRLCAYSTRDGSIQTEIQLDALPVWDGMALAQGSLFLATKDGNIVCFH